MKTEALRIHLLLLTLLAVAITLSISVFALEKGIDIEADSVVLDKTTATADDGYYTVEVPIRITKNSGFVSLRFYVYHPETIELVDWIEGDIFPSPASSNLTSPIEMNGTENGILVFYSEGLSLTNKTSTGTLIKLKYKVPADIELGDLGIELNIKDAHEEDGEQNTKPDKITDCCTVRNGKISVVETRPADVNFDGNVNTLDVISLARHLGGWAGYTDINQAAADANGDGEVTLVDLVCLSRHIAGWKGYDFLPLISNK